jgi:transcriptional regulator with XRE-family HTH domain
MPNRFEELRVRKGFSQEGIAKSAGMNQVQWSRWEKKPPDALEHLAKLVAKHNVNAEWLLGLSDDFVRPSPSGLVLYEESGIYTATSAPLPDGSGLTNIAARLNDDGHISPSGSPWTQSSLVRLLDNVSVYAGYITANRRSQTGAPVVVAKASFAPIIDDNTMQRVLDERRQRLVNRHIPDSPYLLSGICRCSACDGAMIVHHNEHRKQPYKYIVCRHCKPTYAIRETFVMAELAGYISLLSKQPLPPSIDKRRDRHHKTQLKRIGAQLQRLQESVTRLDAAYADGTLTYDRYKTQLERIRRETQVTEADRARVIQSITSKADAHDWRIRLEELRDHGLAMLASGDRTKANAWLRRHVRILCSPDQSIHIETV